VAAVTVAVFRQVPVTEEGALKMNFSEPVAATGKVAVTVTVSPRATLVGVPPGEPVDTALRTMVPAVLTVVY